LVTAAFETHGTVDHDLRDALAALIRTYRTLQTGIYYQTVPENALAAKIFRFVEDGVGEFRRDETKRLGMSRTRDADLRDCSCSSSGWNWTETTAARADAPSSICSAGFSPNRLAVHPIRRRWCCLDKPGGASPRPETPVSFRCSPRGRRIFFHH